MPFFENTPLLPDDPILGLPILFAGDPRPEKVNLGIGSYKTAEGTPLVIDCVRKAENLIWLKQLNKEYLPIDGDQEFIQCILQLIFGADLAAINPARIYASQAVGGSGALRVGAEFLTRMVNKSLFLSQPSWPNHKPLLERGGFVVGSYPYFDQKTNSLDFKGMCAALNALPPSSIVLLHGSCHNPTGVDPTPEQWRELSTLIKKRGLFPFFDLAYQGFAKNLDADAESVRLFAREGHEMAVAYSCAKNFGLYGERVGLLAIIASSPEPTRKIGSQIRTIIRGNYSTPPLHGARIVTTILKSPELTQEWKIELQGMSRRIQEMRQALVEGLISSGINPHAESIALQNGLFSFIGLTPDQVVRLREEKAIYMPPNGRINLAGLNAKNLGYVIESFLSVM